MPDHTWADTAALSTPAPIFDDDVYLSEALGLPINQTEDHVDAALALLASESGVDDPYQFLPHPETSSRAISTMTLESDQRDSGSIHSQETQSTSFTSAPSRTSRDNLSPSERTSATKELPDFALSFPPGHDSDPPAIDRPSGATSRQSSTQSITPSVLSSSSSSHHVQPRKKRGSVILSMFRRRSSSCASTSHHGQHTKPRGAKLACGHSLSAHDVHDHVQEALRISPHVEPKCCGRPIPPSVLEGVLSKEETNLVAPDASREVDPPFRDSGYCEAGLPTHASHSPNNVMISDNLATLPSHSPPRRTRHEAISIDAALANEAFKSYKVQEKEQFERVSAFESYQRKALAAYHQGTIKQLKAHHEASKEERIEKHTADLERLEERQLSAEHDLITAQTQETQNVATALKYIEAYCLGTKSHQEHAHTVSEEDFKKLDRQRLIQKDLPRKHASAINVLRSRQELDTQRKIEMQEAELEQMDVDHEKDIAMALEEHKKEMERLEAVIEARRKRLLQRWDLKFEIWRRDWEEQHSTTLDMKLEHEEWPARKAEHTIIIPESSYLAQYIEAAT